MTKTATIYIRARGICWPIMAQQRACRRAAARLGVTITHEYVEHGQQKGRPTRARMIHDLAGDQPTDLLLIPSYDTLARNHEVWNRICPTLERAGVRLVVADLVGEGTSLAEVRLVQKMHEDIWRYHTAHRRASATTIDQKERA
jgi:DNA invertase Pin-like site-specific DNA recombinase